MKKLEDDVRFVAAKGRLVELQLALASLESERDGLQGRLNQLAHEPKKSKMDEAADALIQDGEISLSTLDSVRQNMAQLVDRIQVHRHAIEKQRRHIAGLVSEISKTIAQEMLPTHKANVKKVVRALLALDQAMIAEHQLRDDLYVNGIEYASAIRPMPITRLGTSLDRFSILSGYLLEALEHGFITEAELPERLHKHIPSKGHGVQVQERVASDSDGWLLAVN